MKTPEEVGTHSLINAAWVRSLSSFEIWEGKAKTLLLELGAKWVFDHEGVVGSVVRVTDWGDAD